MDAAAETVVRQFPAREFPDVTLTLYRRPDGSFRAEAYGPGFFRVIRYPNIRTVEAARFWLRQRGQDATGLDG